MADARGSVNWGPDAIAKWLHDQFAAFMRAGFRRSEALDFCEQILAAWASGPMPSGGTCPELDPGEAEGEGDET